MGELRLVERPASVTADERVVAVQTAVADLLDDDLRAYLELPREPEYTFSINDPTGHIPEENFTVNAISVVLGSRGPGRVFLRTPESSRLPKREYPFSLDNLNTIVAARA